MHETTCAVGLHIHSYRALWLFCFPEMIPHYERQGWVRLLSPEIVFIPEGGKKMFLPKDQIAALIYTDDGLDEEALRTSDELQVLGTPW
jgi:hypothetical protein